jgi:hypothetical protein
VRIDQRGVIRLDRTERDKLIKANNRFVAALDSALRTGAETVEAVEATVTLTRDDPARKLIRGGYSLGRQMPHISRSGC